MRTIERDIVGAFIISADNKILLGQSIKGGVYQDQWVVPGGGIEEGETKIDAVKREVQEEVGIDISDAAIEQIDGVSYGESEKELRETNEIVLVKMTFNDFVVRLLKKSTDIELAFEDDLSFAEWFSPQDLKTITMGPATLKTLQKIGFA